MISKAVMTVLLTGFIAGILVTGAQMLRVTPLILQAETYELGEFAVPHTHAASGITHQHNLNGAILDKHLQIRDVHEIQTSASTEPEAFGRVAVEAQSMEKPIIASNIGGSNETIIDEKTGFLYEAGNAKSLSNKISRTLNMDETLLKSIGNVGRKNIVQKFNVEKMCFSTYSEYKRLLN